MADKEILDAVLRMEATNREDHQLIQTQLRGYAAKTVDHGAKIEGLRRDVDQTCVAVDEHGKAISGIRGQWKIVLAVLIPAMLACGGLVAGRILGSF